MAFLAERVGRFHMYMEDDYAVLVRYCCAAVRTSREQRSTTALRD